MVQRRTHVVVGAGPSGIMLVNLLLHQGDNVILIERGDGNSDSHEDSHHLINWSRAAQREKSGHNDGATVISEKQQHMYGRTISISSRIWRWWNI